MIFLGKENPTFCLYFPMELNKEKKTGLGQMVGTGRMLLILLQNIRQTHCQELKKQWKNSGFVLFFKHNFSNLRILDLSCKNARTWATPWAIVNILTPSYAQRREAGLPCREKGSRGHHGQEQMFPLTGDRCKEMPNAPLSSAGVEILKFLTWSSPRNLTQPLFCTAAKSRQSCSLQQDCARERALPRTGGLWKWAQL